jgi:hypothetical protein
MSVEHRSYAQSVVKSKSDLLIKVDPIVLDKAMIVIIAQCLKTS